MSALSSLASRCCRLSPHLLYPMQIIRRALHKLLCWTQKMSNGHCSDSPSSLPKTGCRYSLLELLPYKAITLETPSDKGILKLYQSKLSFRMRWPRSRGALDVLKTQFEAVMWSSHVISFLCCIHCHLLPITSREQDQT